MESIPRGLLMVDTLAEAQVAASAEVQVAASAEAQVVTSNWASE